jgi:hypothetical protein
MQYVKGELARGLGDWEQRLNTALVPARPDELAKDRKAEIVEHEPAGKS